MMDGLVVGVDARMERLLFDEGYIVEGRDDNPEDDDDDAVGRNV